jgi:hypothetical protein
VKLSGNFAGATALSNADLYASLTTALPATVPTCSTKVLVVPSNVASSFIVTKVSSAAPGCGNQMPAGCATSGNATSPCLTSDQINTISAWIMAGAPH